MNSARTREDDARLRRKCEILCRERLIGGSRNPPLREKGVGISRRADGVCEVAVLSRLSAPSYASLMTCHVINVGKFCRCIRRRTIACAASLGFRSSRRANRDDLDTASRLASRETRDARSRAAPRRDPLSRYQGLQLAVLLIGGVVRNGRINVKTSRLLSGNRSVVDFFTPNERRRFKR